MTNTTHQQAVNASGKLGERVQFSFDGATVTGTLINVGEVIRRTTVASKSEWTIDGKSERPYVERDVVDYTIDVRLNPGEARRYPLSRVTGLVAAPLTGELPTCVGFAGTGQRCASCRTHRRLHG